MSVDRAVDAIRESVVFIKPKFYVQTGTILNKDKTKRIAKLSATKDQGRFGFSQMAVNNITPSETSLGIFWRVVFNNTLNGLNVVFINSDDLSNLLSANFPTLFNAQIQYELVTIPGSLKNPVARPIFEDSIYLNLSNISFISVKNYFNGKDEENFTEFTLLDGQKILTNYR